MSASGAFYQAPSAVSSSALGAEELTEEIVIFFRSQALSSCEAVSKSEVQTEGQAQPGMQGEKKR